MQIRWAFTKDDHDSGDRRHGKLNKVNTEHDKGDSGLLSTVDETTPMRNMDTPSCHRCTTHMLRRNTEASCALMRKPHAAHAAVSDGGNSFA